MEGVIFSVLMNSLAEPAPIGEARKGSPTAPTRLQSVVAEPDVMESPEPGPSLLARGGEQPLSRTMSAWKGRSRQPPAKRT